MQAWEKIFKKQGKVFLKPQEDMKKIIRMLKKEKAKKILDLGCGTGRHTVMLAKAGFDVYGMDISREGLRLTRQWLKKEGLNAVLKEASCYQKFPFKDKFFDAVISIQVIHHNYINKIRYCIKEIERVIKLGGIIFITVAAKKKRKQRAQSKKTAPRTYVPTIGGEKGLPHYIYNKELLKKDFKNFKILALYKSPSQHYCILGKLKERVNVVNKT